MQFMTTRSRTSRYFPTYSVSRLARRHVTVALSAMRDELFGGYDGYVAQGMARHYARLPAFFASA
jgi:asparagine synthase (glutamine-hydrolysing)